MIRAVSIDVCIVDDEGAQRQLLSAVLEGEGFSVVSADGFDTGLECVSKHSPKVCLIDYRLPGGDGIALCRRIRQLPDRIDGYLILITAFGGCELKETAIKSGIDDYLDKPIDQRDLIARVRVGMRIWQMQHRLHSAAITDGLTGLYNHDHFNRVVEREMQRARRYGHPLALIMIDIDHFKAVNDTFGHLVGNDVLEVFARILRENVRDIDTIGRFGGEEFAVVLPESTAAHAASVAERMRLAISETLRLDTLNNHLIEASFGVADSDDPRVNTAAHLVDLADRAMYLAKRRGRNQVARASELNDTCEAEDVIKVDEVEALRRRVAALSVRAKDVYVQNVASLVQALEEKDPYTARHSQNVAFYSEQIARRVGCSEGMIKSVRNAALLHDIGKVGMPDRILLKPLPLTQLEHRLMQQVPTISVRIVDHLRILESEVLIIRHQREYYDGSGKPNELKGNQIPIGSRILLVADAFDAMTTDRVYRARRDIREAVGELRALSGEQFDPRAVVALRQILEDEQPAWQSRIDETVESLRMLTPAGDSNSTTANSP